MTVYENFQNKNIDELVEWIAKHWDFDGAPHWRWWDENYCKKCESIVVRPSELDGYEHEFAYCELNHNCRFFKEMNDIPDAKQVIKMWLESEC